MPLRWAAGLVGGRSPDCLLRPRSPGCLSDCGSYAFGGGPIGSGRALLRERAKITGALERCQNRCSAREEIPPERSTPARRRSDAIFSASESTRRDSSVLLGT